MGSGALGIIAALMAAAPPVSGGSVSFSQVSINDAVGDHFDPHVDGDLAAYSSVTEIDFNFYEQIHYFDFASSTDVVINNTLPDGGLGRDLLSDVDQNRVVFTRIFGNNHSGIMLFDRNLNTTQELAAAANSQRLGVALGGNTVAFIDFSFVSGHGELMVLDLPGATPLRLTNDTADDSSPAVSPDGSTVTWVHCEGSACDIWVARRSGSSWTTAPLAATTDSDTDPDTNGTLVVFQRDDFVSASGTDLVLNSVSGGAEARIVLPGSQRHPSIRGDIVAFENRFDNAQPSDIFVLQLSTNRYFQLTATPGINETLNDVTVLGDGSVRVVWQASDPLDPGNNNIYGATFTLPGAPVCNPGTYTLEANRTYANHGNGPTQWTDGSANIAGSFVIPAVLPVVEGNSGNHWASLTFATASGALECRYRGGSPRPHPTSAADVAAGQQYVFERCFTDAGTTAHTAGDVVAATSVIAHVQVGDNAFPNTRIRVTISSACPTPAVDDSSTSSLQGLSVAEAAPGVGCSSTGESLVPMLAMIGILLALMRGRPAAIRVVATRERRKLSR